MAIYKIYFTEHIVHTFEYEADSKEEANNEFWKDIEDGAIDFSYGEVYDSDYTISEVR